MASISNDQELRDALSGLAADRQRIAGARFAQSVLSLCRDERVRRAADTALDPDAGEAALEDALRAAKAYATKTYTDCGKDTDWLAQADHFVAAAVAAALSSPEQLPAKVNPAWKAAVQARMARNCAMMEEDEVAAEGEPERQYRIAAGLLS
jgi:hypothetical protein